MDRAYTFWVDQEGHDGLLKLHVAEDATLRRVAYCIMDLTGVPPDLQKLSSTSPNRQQRPSNKLAMVLESTVTGENTALFLLQRNTTQRNATQQEHLLAY